MSFAEPGISASSSGCTANGGTMNSFTSVIVSEAGRGGRAGRGG